MTDVIRYEHPLNERIRTLMRLEDLFARVRHFAAQDAAPDHHAALVCLFEITDVAARADLKADLVQELERQKQALAPLRNNPNIEQEALEALLADTDAVATQLLGQQGKVGTHLRDNEWLMAIKQRTAIPGGVSEFDLPAYHYWLNRPAEQRRHDLAHWIDPFVPIAGGVAIVLRLLRENGRTSHHVGASRHVPADDDHDEGRAAAASHAAARPPLRAGDQCEQVRAQYPLPRRQRHGPRQRVSRTTWNSS